MKTKTFLAFILGFTATAAFAQADLRTGAQRTQGSVRITVTIPGVVALEVPDEVVFDLSEYPGRYKQKKQPSESTGF
jgi:hypothetical protein